MAKNKPLKRHKALVELSKDHHFGLLLCWKLRKGLASGIAENRMAAYLTYFFEEHLKEHFLIEEEEIFPVLPEENPLRKEAELQHQELYALVSRIREKEGKEVTNLLKQLEEKLEKHIRFEERVLFMQIQATLSEEKLQKVAKRMEIRHTKKEDQWQDQFWNE